MATYLAGSLVTVGNDPAQIPGAAAFAVAGTPTTPTTTTLRVLAPSGVVTTPALTSTGVGTFVANLDTTGEPGQWSYTLAGTGACQAISQGSFDVQALPF